MRNWTVMAVLAMGFTACTANDNATETITEGTTDVTTSYNSLIAKTQSYPSAYAEEAEHRGRVERIDYNTRDYAEGTGRTCTNTAYVYLPYGYDGNTAQRYNVIYLVHGHYGTAATTFEEADGLHERYLTT